MPTRKKPLPPTPSAMSPTSLPDESQPRQIVGSAMATVSGPSTAAPTPAGAASLDTPPQQLLAIKMAGTEALAAAMPANPLKVAEHGLENGHAPQAGQPVTPRDMKDTASTVTEDTPSAKLGDGPAVVGLNPTNGPLRDRVRVDSGGRMLTTNQGVPVSDNQNSLKAGLRGPTLLEDFVLREKITHFDHERIPERIVHARGSAAHGFFECTHDITEFTRADLFSKVGKRTPVFTRFSTVAGERGSADTVRDVRGFAVKFYTEQGNWDLVGNNIPVFFIQDAMKFPDLVHALKPEPHHAMPQASSAHDTFWDFVSLMPESAHMLLWVMSDRAIPRSYRTMQGFGVHTFRFVNDAGGTSFVKFHWTPTAGTHSLVWDEAVKASGADPDYHRRDLWEAIEAGAYPEWELGVQIFSEEQAEAFPFDVLDATKLVPEELVPIRPVGRMVLNRNPDNFFAETEQVAFCTAHVVPGIDFSNDPLLQGRIHSYVDTQLSRLGGPNFHEIPINAPVVQVHNNQRDGMHRQAIARGRVSYEPNSLAGGCPFQAGKVGFVSFPQPVAEDKVRGKPERFADHYSQARLFWRSQTDVEKAHIIGAFRFELTRVQTEAVRERVISVLANVDEVLAASIAMELGVAVPPPQPTALESIPDAGVDASPGLSLLSRPGDGRPVARKVALLVAPGLKAEPLRLVHDQLVAAGAVPRHVGTRLGRVPADDGQVVHVEISLEAGPSALWDAVVISGGAAAALLAANGQAVEFVKDQYRHCKPILALGDASELFARAGIEPLLPDGNPDPALMQDAGDNAKATAGLVESFIVALGQHRDFRRETDPPLV